MWLKLYSCYFPLLKLSSNIVSPCVVVFVVANTPGIFYFPFPAQNMRAFSLDHQHEKLVGFLEVNIYKNLDYMAPGVSSASSQSVSVGLLK